MPDTNPAYRSGVVLMEDDGTVLGIAALVALIGDASDDAGDPTLIGLLKQIAANTAPA